MSIFEYDEERELKLIRRAEYEEGLKEGREEGVKTLIEKSWQGVGHQYR